jgi:hypothetical protein
MPSFCASLTATGMTMRTSGVLLMKPPDRQRRPAGGALEDDSGDAFQHARPHQRAGQHEHGCDGDRRGIGEHGKHVAGRQQPQHHEGGRAGSRGHVRRIALHEEDRECDQYDRQCDIGGMIRDQLLHEGHVFPKQALFVDDPR